MTEIHGTEMYRWVVDNVQVQLLSVHVCHKTCAWY